MVIPAADSRKRHALQVLADDEGARVGLLDVGDGSLEIELTDVAEHQAPHLRVPCDTTDDIGRGVKTTGCPGAMAKCITSTSASRAKSTKRGSVPV